MALLLIAIICTIIISILWFFSWQRLTDKLMEQRSPRRRWIQYMVVSTAIQLIYNLANSYTSQYWESYSVFVHTAVFTIQGVVMWRMLYSRAKPTKAISSIALTYFFIYSMMFILEHILAYGIINPAEEAGWPYLIYLIYANAFIILFHIVAMVLSILLGRLIEKLRFASYYSNLFNHPVRGWVACVISLILMHCLNLIPTLIPGLDNSTVYLATSLIGGALVLFAILAVSVFESNREKVKMQEEFIDQQQIYVQTLEGLQSDVRAFRHDYQNLLSGMYLQASEGNTETLRKTLQNTLHYFDDRLGNQIKRVTELSRIHITEVKSLLIVKLAQAENLRVNISLEVPSDVNRLDMNTEDFIRCLGILLDNAMEAATETNEEPNEEPVRVALIQEKTGLTIIVANPLCEAPPLHRLGERGYTTKGVGHGTGLSNYKSLTEKYDNIFVITGCSGGVFRQELQIRRAL